MCELCEFVGIPCCAGSGIASTSGRSTLDPADPNNSLGNIAPPPTTASQVRAVFIGRCGAEFEALAVKMGTEFSVAVALGMCVLDIQRVECSNPYR